MGKRDELIEMYASELKEKCGVDADMDFLTSVTIACGPSIYDEDGSTVAGSDDSEIQTIVDGFIANKLGVKDEAKAKASIDAAIETYGRSNRNKYRAVVYYLIAQNLGKSEIL